MTQTWLKIDGVNINAGHVVAKGKEAGIKELSVAGGNPGKSDSEREKWAAKAYDQLEKHLNRAARRMA